MRVGAPLIAESLDVYDENGPVDSWPQMFHRTSRPRNEPAAAISVPVKLIIVAAHQGLPRQHRRGTRRSRQVR